MVAVPVPKCRCAKPLPTLRRTCKSNKNGNQGRTYFSCCITNRKDKCNFFKWEDELQREVDVSDSEKKFFENRRRRLRKSQNDWGRGGYEGYEEEGKEEEEEEKEEEEEEYPTKFPKVVCVCGGCQSCRMSVMNDKDKYDDENAFWEEENSESEEEDPSSEEEGSDEDLPPLHSDSSSDDEDEDSVSETYL